MSVIEDVRLPYCEYCGKSTSNRRLIEVHHIKTRGAGGKDIRENLINLGVYPLCNCHRLAQEYKIPRAELIFIVAEREGITPEEACEAIGLVWEHEEAKLNRSLESRKPKPQISLEEVIARLLDIDETEKQALFAKGDLLLAAKEVFGEKGFADYMASQLGCTARYVQEMIKVSKTFPTEKRAMDQSWYLHRLAAQTKEPEKWLGLAVKHGWSTRQLKEAIEQEKDKGPEEVQALKRAERLIKSISEFLKDDGDLALEQVKVMYKLISEFLEGVDKDV